MLPRPRRPARALRALPAHRLEVRATGRCGSSTTAAARAATQRARRRARPRRARHRRRRSSSVQLLRAQQRRRGALATPTSLVFLNNDTEIGRAGLDRAPARRTRCGRRSAPSRRSCSTPTGACSTPASRSACTAGRVTRSRACARTSRRRSACAATGPRNWLAVTAACMMVERRLVRRGRRLRRALRGRRRGRRPLPAADRGRLPLAVRSGRRVLHDESATPRPGGDPAGRLRGVARELWRVPDAWAIRSTTRPSPPATRAAGSRTEAGS